MRLATFSDIVREAAGIPLEQAEQAASATLKTLAERISGGEADDIAAFIPRELRGVLTSVPEPAEPFGLDEFVRRVAEREGVDEATARRHAEAVFVALGQAVAPGELRDMAAQLPREYEPLLEAAQVGRRAAPEEDPLVTGVAHLASLDPPMARRAVEAVLETLAVRISEGEVEDLMERLPVDLTPALERGLLESRRPRRMSLDEFLERVAGAEGVDRDEAGRHARAVFAALRALVSGKEIHDVESELPAEYAPLFSGIV
ncbi:MAG TPA: DUF2267 domain-containing protein [Solirubrobacteraceae bacterium]|jgi:uncharacterized protein (DUF2267 family)|nr:DUF2267 domain-containing protein [Solirubrobacteraceae bacterium]